MCGAKVIGVSENGHLCFSRDSDSLCGVTVDSSVRLLPDYEDPVETPEFACEDCAAEYQEWIKKDGNTRAPTVQCECKIVSKEEIQPCQNIVSAYRARELSRPQDSRNIPVCSHCYKWILSIDVNDIETPYENATPWLERSTKESVSSS